MTYRHFYFLCILGNPPQRNSWLDGITYRHICNYVLCVMLKKQLKSSSTVVYFGRLVLFVKLFKASRVLLALMAIPVCGVMHLRMHRIIFINIYYIFMYFVWTCILHVSVIDILPKANRLFYRVLFFPLLTLLIAY